MEQREADFELENQASNKRAGKTKGKGGKVDDGGASARKQAKLDGGFLVTDNSTEDELKAKLSELQAQLDASGDMLSERETEISGLKMNLESQIESLKAYVEISESVGRTESALKARIAELEMQLDGGTGILETRQNEYPDSQAKPEPRFQTLEAELHKRDEALASKESILQIQEQRYQEELNELRDELGQKGLLLKELEATVAGLGDQSSSQSQSLQSEKQTEVDLKARIAELENQLIAEEWDMEARDQEVSELKTTVDPQVEFLKHQLQEREDEIQAKESALQQQGESLQSEINDLRIQLTENETFLNEREEAMAGVSKETITQNKSLISEKQMENDLKEKLSVIQGQLAAQNGILEKREAELSTVKKKMKSQAQVFEAKRLAKDEALKTKESGMQLQGEKLQVESDDPQTQLSQREAMLKEGEEAMAAAEEQAKSQRQLLESEQRTEFELTAKITDLQAEIEAKEGTLKAREVEVAELRNKVDSQIQSLEARLHEKEETLKERALTLQQQAETFQIEFEGI